MFDEVSKINKIKECKEKFELPRTLARENYKHFDLPRNHFSDVKSEVKEDTFELSRKIVNDVEKNIAKTLEEKIIDGKPLRFKDIKNYLVYPSLKETITASAYASSVLMALKKTNPELVKVDAKSLENDLDKFYNSNLKEISRNNDDIVEKLKSNDFAKKTLEVTTSLIYISGKLILDAGVAIENGLNVGLDSAAKFFDQPILDDINFDLFSNLSNEFSVYFKDLENLKQLDNFILALEEIPLTIAELYLTIYASSIYLATKIVLGAGHVVEDSLKFILEGGAFLFGQEEFAKKVQKSHIVNDISKVVDDSLNDSLKFLDKISKMTNVSKVVNPLHQVGKIGEIVGELGTEISLTIGSLATGNIPLAVCLIAISACNVGGEAVDLAVEKTGEFTWKEMMFGVAVAAVDAVAYGISRNITSYGLKVTQNFTKSFEKFIGNSVLGGIDASIFELSNIIKPLLENQLEIDKKAKIDWKQIGINTGFGFVLGGILPAVAEVINVNKLKKIEKIKKEYSVIVDQLKKGSSIKNTKLKKLVGKKTFDIIKKGDDKLLDTFKKLPEETAEAIKLYGKKYTEILSNLTRVKERTVYTRLMAEKNGDKLLRFLNSLDTKDQISMLKKFAYDGFEKSYLLLDSVPFKKIYRKPKLFDTEYKKIKSKISKSIKNNGADVVDMYGITLNDILLKSPMIKHPLIIKEFINSPDKLSEFYKKYNNNFVELISFIDKSHMKIFFKNLDNYGDDIIKVLKEVSNKDSKSILKSIDYIEMKGKEGIYDLIKWNYKFPSWYTEKHFDVASKIIKSSSKNEVEKIKKSVSIKLSTKELDMVRQEPKFLGELVYNYTGKSFGEGFLEFFIRLSKQNPKQANEIWNYSKAIRDYIKNKGIRAGGVHEWLMCDNFMDFLTNPKWRKDGAYLAKCLSTLVQSTDSVYMKNVRIGGIRYKKWSHKMEEKIFGNGKIHDLIKKVVKEAENTEDFFIKLNKMVKENFSKETYKNFSKAWKQCFA